MFDSSILSFGGTDRLWAPHPLYSTGNACEGPVSARANRHLLLPTDMISALVGGEVASHSGFLLHFPTAY